MLKMSKIPPEGYNPIEKIRGGHLHWVSVPFNGVPVFVQVRCLNYTQLRACGDISLITLDGEKTEKEISLERIIEIKNYQEKLCEESLVVPRFDEIIETITGMDFKIREKKQELEEMKKRLEDTPKKSRRKKIEKTIENLELEIGFLLPDDFMAAITSWAMGIDRTDIKKITRDMLLEAAILAKNGGDNPCDHITGVFTDFQKEDINKNAWIVYNDYQEEKKIERENKKGGVRWIGGKRKKKR
jgi:hypothetical protein